MSTASQIALHAAGLSHMGVVREENQDTIRLNESNSPTHGRVYAIADGMGGYAQGGLASKLALDTFYESFYSGNSRSITSNLKQSVEQANLAVYQTAHRNGIQRMGTTLTAVNIVGNQLHVAHVGDCRAYLIRQRRAKCLTTDHTMVGELVRMGVLTPDKVRTHAQRSVLNRCLGVNLFVQPDITTYNLQANDIIIVCSDGVWSMILDEDFLYAAQHSQTPQELSQILINLAMERQSDDNVSVISLFIESLADLPTQPRSKLGTWLQSWTNRTSGDAAQFRSEIML